MALYPELLLIPESDLDLNFLQSVSSSDINTIINKHNALRSAKSARAMCKLVSGITFSTLIKIYQSAKLLKSHFE